MKKYLNDNIGKKMCIIAISLNVFSYFAQNILKIGDVYYITINEQVRDFA